MEAAYSLISYHQLQYWTYAFHLAILNYFAHATTCTL